MAQNQQPYLSPDILESQISMVDLLTAMFPSPGEVEIPESTSQCVEKLRQWCEDPSLPMPPGIPASIYLTVCLSVANGEKYIQVSLSIPLTGASPDSTDQSPPTNYSLRQPDWMSKAELGQLVAGIPQDDALEMFEYVQERVNQFLDMKKEQEALAVEERINPSNKGPVVRVWFYFPSLSTRKKRDDMVNNAPAYSLTGFVLAGKPGVLCLEGTSVDIDAYMSFIKTHSWGDIPSHQKKVSERFREKDDVERVFDGMEEITDSLGERGGQRANRGDMQALEAWLSAKGLQEAFEKVIF